MTHLDVQIAMNKTLGAPVPGTDRQRAECELADAVYGFLMALKSRSPWYVVIGIRAIHGVISDWKRSRGCP